MIGKMLDNCREKRRKKLLLKRWLAGSLPDDEVSAQDHKYIQDTMRSRIKKIKRRFRRSVSIHMFIRNITIKPVGRLLRPLPVKWQEEFYDGILYPHCPACGELAYEKDHCVFCGRRFSKWDDQL